MNIGIEIARVAVTEYAAEPNVLDAVELKAGLDATRIRTLLERSGERVMQLLRLSGNPITVGQTGVLVRGVAGLLRVAPMFELEIAPKFLSHQTPFWREDFFLAATISRFGRILPAERLSAAIGQRGDLMALIARALVQMFSDNRRRPLRTYRLHKWADFAIDGDLDPEAVTLPEDDGYHQQGVLFDRKNRFNAVIQAAAEVLVPEVRDPSTRQQLERIHHALAPQSRVRLTRASRVPTRSIRWKPAYDLAVQILDGIALRYGESSHHVPGYVLEGWRVWEDLITWGLRADGAWTVTAQCSAKLGTRARHNGDEFASTNVLVRPDVVVDGGTPATAMIVDAKYKGRAGGEATKVHEADLYEALAFARALNISRVALVYPRKIEVGVPAEDPGTTRVFETVVVDGTTIYGIDVEARGIARTEGLRLFARNLAVGLRALKN